MMKERTMNGTDAKAEQEERDDIFELIKAMLVAAFIAVTIRTFLFEPFNIPSSSMYPTLLVGDYLFVEKYSYGYSRYSFPLGMGGFDGRILEKQPARGDIAVFRLPSNTRVDYIKRIVGLPGDRLQMIEGVLHINGKAVPREYLGTQDMADGNAIHVFSKYLERLPDGAAHKIFELTDEEMHDETPVYIVPDGHYFAMGDNRDMSLDSRVSDKVGFIPAENLVGRAAFLFFSTEGITDQCQKEGALAAVKTVGCWFATVPGAIRYDRIFKSVSSL